MYVIFVIIWKSCHRVCLFIYSFICLFIHWFIIHLYVTDFVYLSTHLFIYFSIIYYTFISIYLCTWLIILLSIAFYIFIYLFICSLIYLFIFLYCIYIDCVIWLIYLVITDVFKIYYNHWIYGNISLCIWIYHQGGLSWAVWLAVEYVCTLKYDCLKLKKKPLFWQLAAKNKISLLTKDLLRAVRVNMAVSITTFD